MIDNVEDINIIPKRIPLTCGLVMPISKNIDYSEEHWRSVKQIIIEAMQNSKKYTIETKIVSESDESGILQRNIVKGIYDSDIVCVLQDLSTQYCKEKVHTFAPEIFL